jgi:starch synthase (maltosyl-transferring)
MTGPVRIEQYPAPGSRMLRFCGDTQTFRLEAPETGSAWLRTQIGRAGTIREEIVRSVHENLPPLGRGWFDFPMVRRSGGAFEITLPLCQVGHFEAKCFYLEARDSDPVWPQGDNTVINVAPADTCCANLVYNAFVRQFGPNKAGLARETDALKDQIEALDHKSYTVIPPSGTFRDLIGELDFIMGRLGCRIIQLLPIHPTPTTYGRMGRFGSPYAALSFTGVDPALAQFDPHATPLEQFEELVDGIHRRHGKLLLDIAINHTGWAAGLHETHPRWLAREPDGRITVPEAWGVKWEDLTKLDYSHKDLWRYMARVFLTWCRRGVDGFRCDAGYMIPVPAWRYIVARVREQYPDTVFFVEGLGGKISVTRALLNLANFNWAYSELFQNYTRHEIESYLPEAMEISRQDGLCLHYAETHDNPRLAQKSKSYARLRTDLCALFSSNGAFGFANGVEWFATEKIVVHEAKSLNWGATDNQVAQIHRLSSLLKHHPAFHDGTELRLVAAGPGNHVALLRHHRTSGKKLLILANLDEEAQVHAAWQPPAMSIPPHGLVDLLSGDPVVASYREGLPGCQLQAGQAVCLGDPSETLSDLEEPTETNMAPVPRLVHQRLRAKALEVFCSLYDLKDLADFDPDLAAQQLAEDPEAFCRRLNPTSKESRVILWQWPEDTRRIVMVPPEHFLLIRCDAPFRARITDKDRTLAQEEGLPDPGGRWFALFSPHPPWGNHLTRTLQLSVYHQPTVHTQVPLLFLARPETLFVQRALLRYDLETSPRTLLLTNGRGGMCHTPLLWGKLQSRYDALLSANLNPHHPVDRWNLLARCRAWVVFQGYSQEISFDCLHAFHLDEQGRGLWRFHVPTGQGEHIRLTIRLQMVQGKEAVTLTFYRHPSARRQQRLTDHQPVRLIIRPDVDSRNFHWATKAYLGPETRWPQAVASRRDGFRFAPDPDRGLDLSISNGRFMSEPEWQYMVHLPSEAERGFDPVTDLFSPGYFVSELPGDCSVLLSAQVVERDSPQLPRVMDTETIQDEIIHAESEPMAPAKVLTDALDDYTVARGSLKTVIAGYPWFLDWGRDALIFTRGLISAGRMQDAIAILKQFGRFEKDGTLPNMILGEAAANRDTSDAPLWFIVAVADVMAARRSKAILDTRCGGRTIRQIVHAIVTAYMAGTPNGIRMDPDSALVFSPAHFTWMDTNHPAGTPREGYPIEIQALWHHALCFLSLIDRRKRQWSDLAARVQKSISDLFFIPEHGFLSDCRHASAGVPASLGEPDDALRPNQLFAITLKAVTDPDICRGILAACETLLVPGGIRSLADRPLMRPLPISHGGQALNDPHRPYFGRYEGDEDTRRKPAYHNGTAWTWPFPSFCEAWAIVYGQAAVPAALARLASATHILNRGCLGHVPEILDGDAPHWERGCDAQAWSASEWIRVWNKLIAWSANSE